MGACGSVLTPTPNDPKNNPGGQFLENDIVLNEDIRGYSMLPVLDTDNTLSYGLTNYCIPYGPFLTVGVGVFLAIGLAVGILAIITGGVAAGAYASLAAVADFTTGVGEAIGEGVNLGLELAGAIPSGSFIFGESVSFGDALLTESAITSVYSQTVEAFESTYYALDIASAIIDLASELNTLAKLSKYANDVNSFCESIGNRDQFGNPQWIGIFNPKITGGKYLEWLVVDQKNSIDSCTAFSQDRFHENAKQTGCCGNGGGAGRGCAQPGRRPRCIRNKNLNTGEYFFTGNPAACCFADYRINANDDPVNPPACYEDPATKRRTCSPFYRDLSAPACQNVIEPFCLGESFFPVQNDWMELWLLDSEIDISSFMKANDTPLAPDYPWSNVDTTSKVGFETVREMANSPGNTRMVKAPCLTAIARAMYSQADQIRNWQDLTQFDLLKGTVNPEGYAWAQNLLNKVFEKYQKEYGSFIGAVDQDGYERSSKFVDLLKEICSRYPQLCQTGLKGFCSNVSASDLPYITNGQQWCGCFLPEVEYEKYDRLGIPRECNPLCNASGNIPLTDSNYAERVCRDTTCVIDDLTIDIVSSRFPNGFGFNQLCRSCGEVNINEVSNQILFTSNGNNIVVGKNDSPSGLDKGSIGADGILYPYSITSSGSTSYPQELETDFKLNDFELLTSSEISTVKDTYVSQEFLLFSLDVEAFCKVTFNIKKGTFKDSSNISHSAWGIVSLNVVQDGVGYTNKMITHPYLATAKIPDYFPTTLDPNPSGVTSFNVITISIRFTDTQRSSTNYDATNFNTITNSCSCVISDSNIDAIDSTIRGLNLNQNCGSSNCTNAQGQTIACSSDSSTFQNIGSFKDSISDFRDEQIGYRLETVLIVLIILMIIFLIAFYAVMR